MVQPTEAAAFYDKLAPDYDTMTGFEKRFASETALFKNLVERFALGSAVDAGCGTGFLSIILAKLGLTVTSADISPEMVSRLKEHAKAMAVSVRPVLSSFHDLPSVIRDRHDVVFCMGNSLPHLLTHEDLLDAFKSFAAVLKPGGLLVTQTLNYDRILARRESIQNVKEVNDKIFVRYYEFGAEVLRFNILKLFWSDGVLKHELDSVDLRPILEAELRDLLPLAGFIDVGFYGGINLEKFDALASRDVVVLARKAA